MLLLTKRKNFFTKSLAAILLLAAAIPATPAAATSYGITAGTNGAGCGSGGYFTPAGLTVTAGQSVTVTFSVPANDPYPAGLEIRGFPGGTFQIPLGGSSSTTFTASSSFNFSSYWPSSACHKTDGTITVNQPAPIATAPPAPPPPPPAAAKSTPKPTAVASTPAPATPILTTSPTPSPSPSASSSPSASPTPQPQPTLIKNAAFMAIGGFIILLILGAVGFVVYRRLRLKAPDR